ncbi:MAG TPA: long-chain fatty acid--CoA ligase, partial [Burkholderiales bacterium]|nr:long-chain fatty acid--CoA ligase [Burkholderiales bacterium]
MSTTKTATLPAGFPAMSIARAHELLTSTPGSPLEIERREIRGVPINTWKNAPPTLRDIYEAGLRFGPRTWLVLEDERVTFDSHHSAVTRLAHCLIEAGVK